MSLAVVNKLTRRNGVAGQVSITADVTYTNSQTPASVTFVGTTYGEPGPVIMVIDGGTQIIVDSPARFGDKFDESWVTRFYAS